MTEEMIIYKFIVTIPGQSMTWYGNEPINYRIQVGFPRPAHGLVYEARIPRDCSIEDLINYLNGLSPDSFTEHKIAFLMRGYWVPFIEKSPPTAVDVISAFINGEYRND
ncbi:MAG: hypothetical protein WC479_04510 [Candidatus Izemoplasmatales bacterium]|jgi:hypothetical protein